MPRAVRAVVNPPAAGAAGAAAAAAAANEFVSFAAVLLMAAVVLAVSGKAGSQPPRPVTKTMPAAPTVEAISADSRMLLVDSVEREGGELHRCLLRCTPSAGDEGDAGCDDCRGDLGGEVDGRAGLRGEGEGCAGSGLLCCTTSAGDEGDADPGGEL